MNTSLALLSLLMMTLIYAEIQQQPTPTHIASYIPKQQQPQPHQYNQYIYPAQWQHQLNAQNLKEREIQTNQIYRNALSTNVPVPVTQMINGKSSTDDVDSSSPMRLVVSGLKAFTSLMGSFGKNSIYRLDTSAASAIEEFVVALINEMSSMNPQKMKVMARDLIDIEVALLDLLKRTILEQPAKDRNNVSKFGLASITMLKAFVKTSFGSSSEMCMEKYMCQAATECNDDIGVDSILCKMGRGATSYILQTTTGKPFEKFYNAAQKVKQGDSCQTIYVECSDNLN